MLSRDKYLEERITQVTNWKFLEEYIILGILYLVGNATNVNCTSLCVEFDEQIVTYAISFGKVIKENVKTKKKLFQKLLN